MNVKLTSELLKRWASLTDGNYHGQVREEIAKWFQATKEWKEKFRLRDYVAAFKYVNAEHERIGHVPFELLLVRNIMTHAMLDDIAKVDPRSAELINGCL